MNILMISHYAGAPKYGMEFRAYYMGREWVKMGHKVMIVGATFSHLRKQQPPASEETLDGIDYLWLPTTTYDGNGLKRALSMVQFAWGVVRKSKRLLAFHPDVVVASSVHTYDILPSYRIARKASKKGKKAKFVYEVHDLWPLSPQELGGYSKWHPFIWSQQFCENFAYRHCDAVVSLLPNAFDHMHSHGLAPEKYHYVPNGIELSEWEEPKALPQEHQALLDGLKSDGRFLIGFAGNHGVANALYAAIDAIGPLASEGIDFVLVGNGPEKERLQTHARDKGYGNIHFLPAISKASIPTFLSHMDGLYIGLQRQPLFRFGVSPNKLFDYMMAGKPIIQAIAAGNNPVEEAHCGFAVEPDNTESIRQTVLKLKNTPLDERVAMGHNGYLFVRKNHSIDILSQLFIDAITDNQ